MASYESAAEMEEVITRWLALIPDDEAIIEGCKGYDVSVEFEVEDLDIFFYTHFTYQPKLFIVILIISYFTLFKRNASTPRAI